MKIKEIGGEFALIDRLADIVAAAHADVVQGIGDDAAVIRLAPEPMPYLLVTTDLLVEDQHFRRIWATPHQIGFKASECNVSDIAAMGGGAQWMFVSLALPEDTEVEWIEALYQGIACSCRQHGIVLLGGDTTRGPVATINIALLGSVAPQNLCLRSHAQPGDLLMVTGHLGGSAAGLALFSDGRSPSDYLMRKHLEPRCRMDVAGKIAPLANAMIDISDGLGAEVHHLCIQSGVGAEIRAEAIPLHDEVVRAGRVLGVDPLQWAIGGGEDFELLFSVPSQNVSSLEETGIHCQAVGRVTNQAGSVILIDQNGHASPLQGGYNHFRS